jgi:hypothetical protein
MAVVLAVGSDTLNLANGNNSVTVSGTESIHGGTAFDTVTLGDATPVTINSIESVIGSSGNDQVTINADFGVSTVTASFNLDGGNDTVNLNFFGPGTVANLSLTNVEHLNSAAGGVQTVNLSNDVGLTSVDLGIGFHTLNLAPGDHNLSVANVFELHSFGNNNDTITFDVGPAAGPGVIVTVNQIIDLGWGGTDVLNLTGANDQLSMSIYGGPGLTVHDQTASGDVDLNLRNQQAGATYDLGDGNDTLHLFEDPDGFTSGVSVRNVETVIGTNNSDTITILDGTSQTTVLGSGGVDFITASNGDDHIRFDSFTDSTEGPGRDQVTGFNAANDVFEFAPGVLSGPVHFVGDGNVAPAVGSEQTFDGGGQVEARLANVGGLTVLQIDADGNGSMGGATDMEIQLTGVVGPLTDLNFLIV